MSKSESVDSSYFDHLFAESTDPWAFKTRWYESRKRALTLACLPAARYDIAYEPGCANGELSVLLAERCDSLLISDGVDKAVELAKNRVSGMSHVKVTKAWIPKDWPSASFDLIVLSELGYYLGATALRDLAEKTRSSLRDGGTVLACHWRHRIAGCDLDGDEVHELLDDRLHLYCVSQIVEADLRIDVWCTEAASVAQRGGLL